jgi:transcriptional regulator with XRE-family HTH domain
VIAEFVVIFRQKLRKYRSGEFLADASVYGSIEFALRKQLKQAFFCATYQNYGFEYLISCVCVHNSPPGVRYKCIVQKNNVFVKWLLKLFLFAGRLHNMDLGRIFVFNMKKYRKIAGLSQEKLAVLCEASHSFIRQIECGSRYPSFLFIAKLAKALKIEAYQLLQSENPAADKREDLQSFAEDINTAVSAAIEEVSRKYIDKR